MRHGKKFNHLGRTASHRKAMLSNMGASLLLHKRISTTLAKAKELKKFVEDGGAATDVSGEDAFVQTIATAIWS